MTSPSASVNNKTLLWMKRTVRACV